LNRSVNTSSYRKKRLFETHLATYRRIYSILELNLQFETTHNHVKFWFDWLRNTQVIEVTTSKNAVFWKLLSNQWADLLHVRSQPLVCNNTRSCKVLVQLVDNYSSYRGNNVKKCSFLNITGCYVKIRVTVVRQYLTPHILRLRANF
jgi:hypothetical protein